MPTIIFNKDDDSYSADYGYCFHVKNEHLWKEIYHKLAFLAESGNGKDVKWYENYLNFKENNGNDETN